MDILHINTTAVRGGAALVARQLHEELRRRGHRSWMAVGRRDTDDPDVHRLPNDQHVGWWGRVTDRLVRGFEGPLSRTPGAAQAAGVLRISHSRRAIAETLRGHEVFDFPGTRAVLDLPPSRPEVLHLHNLHGSYFDLRALPELSTTIPTVVTLHDEWLFTGHCAYTFSCERWRNGCGHCPDLRTYPPLLRDGTAQNWLVKRDIYRASALHLVTPSQWLMSKLSDSIVMEAARSTTVIPNAIDLEVFTPGDASKTRSELGIDPSSVVLLLAGNANRRSPFKGFAVFEAALEILGSRWNGQRLLALMVGDDAPPRRFGEIELRFLPFQSDREHLASVYRCADVFVHPALAEAFGLVTLEAQACGLPVIASNVGALPEQITPLTDDEAEPTAATGILVPPGDPISLARAIERLVNDPPLRTAMGRNASRSVSGRFDLETHLDAYLDLYRRAHAATQRPADSDAEQ